MTNTNETNFNLFLLKDIIELQSKIYISLFVFETAFKNQLVHALRTMLGADWLLSQLKNEKNTLFSNEATLINKRNKTTEPISEAQLINEASFGFWIEMFEKKIYKELKGVPIKSFKYLPTNFKRKQIYQLLLKVKFLRNDLYHHRMKVETGKKNNLEMISKLFDGERTIRILINYLEPLNIELLSTDFFELFEKVKLNLEKS